MSDTIFFNEDSFNLDIELGRHYYKADLNFKIKLLRIDVVNTKSNKLYRESLPGQKRFLTPTELNVVVRISESEQKLYSDTSVVREDSDVEFYIYIDELKEKNIDINRGDYFMYELSGKKIFYEITYANNVTNSNKQTILGYRPFYRKIKGTPVKADTINLEGL